jgi:hypothetical protein
MIISYNSLGKARWRKSREAPFAAPQKTMWPDVRLEKAGKLDNMLNNGAAHQ